MFIFTCFLCTSVENLFLIILYFLMTLVNNIILNVSFEYSLNNRSIETVFRVYKSCSLPQLAYCSRLCLLNFIFWLIIVPSFIFSLDLKKCVSLQKYNGSVPCKEWCVASPLFCLHFSFNEILILIIWNHEISSYHYLNSWIYRHSQESNWFWGRNCSFYRIIGIHSNDLF